VAYYYEHGDEPSGSTKWRIFLDQVVDSLFLFHGVCDMSPFAPMHFITVSPFLFCFFNQFDLVLCCIQAFGFPLCQNPGFSIVFQSCFSRDKL